MRPTRGTGGHSRDAAQAAARTLQRCEEESEQPKEKPGGATEHEGSQQVTGQPGTGDLTTRGGGPECAAGQGVQCPEFDLCGKRRLFL